MYCDVVGGCPKAFVDVLDVLHVIYLSYYFIIIIIIVHGFNFGYSNVRLQSV